MCALLGDVFAVVGGVVGDGGGEEGGSFVVVGFFFFGCAAGCVAGVFMFSLLGLSAAVVGLLDVVNGVASCAIGGMVVGFGFVLLVVVFVGGFFVVEEFGPDGKGEAVADHGADEEVGFGALDSRGRRVVRAHEEV